MSSHDFKLPTQTKKIIVPPDADSEPCIFQLIPLRVGQVGILLEVYDTGEVVTASTKIRVNCQESQAKIVDSESRVLVSLPLATTVYAQQEEESAAMSNFTEIKKKTLQQQRDNKIEEYEAVMAQAGRALDESSHIRLMRNAEHLAGEIEKIEAELAQLGALAANPIPSTPTPPADLAASALLRLQLLRKGENKMVIRGTAVPGGGQPRATVPLPYTLTQLPAILKALDVGSYDPKRFKPEYAQALADLGLLHENRLLSDFHAQVGQKLYQALFAGEIGDELRRAQRASQSILCQLQFDPEDVFLAQFPWELIHDAFHFCEMLDITITRSVAFAVPLPELKKLTSPMRLLLISPRPQGEGVLILQETAVQAGLANLIKAEQVSYQTLTPPTWAALAKKLRHEKFDIIHFDGHGSFARECPVCATAHYPSQERCVNCQADMQKEKPQGYLHFEDAQGELDRVNLSEMKTALAKSRAQLVFLSACGSGVTHGISVFNGIAPTLIRLGVPVVVAMQASPPDASSTLFVQEFYESLVEEEKMNIEVAVGNGRQAIFRRQPNEPVSWFMPVIYSRHTAAS